MSVNAPAVHLGDVDPSVDNPELTRTKLGRQFGQQIDWGHIEETLSDAPKRNTVDGLDVGAVSRAHGPETAYMPRRHIGSFAVEYGMRGPVLEQAKREAVTKWLDVMHKRGFDLVRSGRIQLVDGPNPSIDPTSGQLRPGFRDLLAGAYFVERHPETLRIDVDDDMLAPTVLTQRPTSGSGED